MNGSRLAHTVRFIWSHPLGGAGGLRRFARWQFHTRVLGLKASRVRWVDDSYLIVRPGMQGATGNLYCGLHEFDDMAFLLDLLRPSDLFIDVGANVGSYSILASAVCGAHSLALEPGDEARKALVANVSVNAVDQLVEVRSVAASDTDGSVLFTTGLDTTNKMVQSGLEGGSATTEVECQTLDHVVADRDPVLIKVDVEGWEESVLRGAHEVLQRESLLACIVEMNGFDRSGAQVAGPVVELMSGFGFRPAFYSPADRRLAFLVNPAATNVIFVRNVGEIMRRLEDAPSRRVIGRTYPTWPPRRGSASR